MFNKKSQFFVLLLLICVLFSKQGFTSETSPYVLVSVAPHEFFVKKIAGDLVRVGLLVPPGASSHTYEPSPKQILEASKADLWFVIGETFENRSFPALRTQNPNIKAIDLKKNLDLIYATHDHGCCSQKCCHGAGGVDVHFWLSTRQAQIQAKTITDALIATYPQYKAQFEQGLRNLVNELQILDRELGQILQNMPSRIILVSHPAYAYFVRDYGIEQYSIEFEGKDPSPQQLTKLLNLSRQKNLHTIFIQKQYHNKGAKLIAKELKANLVMLDPYSGDYFNAMREIARAFAGQQ